MKAAKISTAMLVAVGLFGVVTACTSNGIDALALTETEPGVLELTTTCADSLSADIEETADEVLISGLQGNVINGDCAGVLRIELRTPLEGRQVVVGSERWVDLPVTCPWGLIGPSDLGDRLESCALE